MFVTLLRRYVNGCSTNGDVNDGPVDVNVDYEAAEVH